MLLTGLKNAFCQDVENGFVLSTLVIKPLLASFSRGPVADKHECKLLNKHLSGGTTVFHIDKIVFGHSTPDSSNT